MISPLLANSPSSPSPHWLLLYTGMIVVPPVPRPLSLNELKVAVTPPPACRSSRSPSPIVCVVSGSNASDTLNHVRHTDTPLFAGRLIPAHRFQPWLRIACILSV